jgi:dihydrodipicolinate synthase/N-acetylneuraminate lyase
VSALLDPRIGTLLRGGLAIPAHPLALDAARRLDERRQRALSRYYIAAGAGGLAVGVHTTQFAIRDPAIGLLRPVLELAREEMSRADRAREAPLLRIAGICGDTRQALDEARLLVDLGYHAGLLRLTGDGATPEDALIERSREVAEVIPLVGFYLQAAVGGRELSYAFWRRFAEIEGVVAIKVAPFNRYRTVDVLRAIVDSGRRDIAVYTGNDDSIVVDLLTTFHFEGGSLGMVGGLLGHWSVWTRRAVELFHQCRRLAVSGAAIPASLLTRASEVTDCNAAFFDAAHGFRGCIAGLHEVLRRQGLFEGIWCLDEQETLSDGQRAEIDRVARAYPHLDDSAFVAEHRDTWLRP